MNASGFPGRDGTIGPDLGWRDGDRMVCRGWRESDAGPPVPVLRVLSEAEHPAPATLERLAHEFALKDILQRSWAVLPLELARDHGRPVLVLEDPGGEPLERLLRGPLPLERCLRLAIGIAGALAGMRQCGLIHKDIRPLNILVGPDGESVRLTGFGIASRMPREQPAAAPAEAIDGTLAYMAPEQTGRMNRSVDARSDLYAFGVTLYRMLTGVLPFTSDDPMELVHCHMARRPPSPVDLEPGLPPAVADIVLKLLAKTPEERYQTALGVAADLRRCLDAWQSAGWIERFRPGGRDIPDTLRIPERLYGRDLEVRSLLDAFHRVLARGTPELALVSGYSGIGKSSVVNELHRAIVPSRGLFAAGKFEQHKRDIPYGTLAGALQALVRQLLVKRENELARWRDAIGASLGANARLVMELVPELERVIGPQPPVTPLPPAEAETRFRAILNRFLGVFAKPEHPLVLFLDDLQWLDAATLGFLADAISPPASLCLLAIGAYRSNEVGPGHPLTQMLDRVRATGSAVQEVLLGPLSENDMRRMVSETAGCEEATAEPLARLMHGKTDGNPFFAIHFLTLLWKEGLFAFDAVQGAWQWDIDAIRAEGFTDNVVELMAGKLTRLPAATQDALKRLACLGSAGTTATLSMVCGKPAEAIHAALWPAVQDGLLLRSDSLYRFIHDRVQEAAHALIPRGERAAEYLRIGRLLAAHAPAAEIEAGVFDIVHQLNRGAALLTAPEERRRVAELNLMAGNRARRSAAYASALAYFKAGIAVLDKHCWEQCYALCFALDYQQAECEFLTGNTAAAEWGAVAAVAPRRQPGGPGLGHLPHDQPADRRRSARQQRAGRAGLPALARHRLAGASRQRRGAPGIRFDVAADRRARDRRADRAAADDRSGVAGDVGHPDHPVAAGAVHR
ncbi:MAG TPA: AAA family ATPase [Acetobacteraceae bacterium]|nr:AAA family ATPase [Acetobacteraceae bacterium]